nr:60S ribosomal protein L5 [Paratrimastix eleionoma]
MAFKKIVKSPAYFKRYQVQFRRRRQGKTDYRARRRLVCQDKNKYGTPKYRLIVRITGTDVVCQVAYARLVGDFIICAAYSHELPRYGVPVGLSNYAACYCTGLLLARRLLTKLKLDGLYKGIDKVTGEIKNVVANENGPKPFKAFLDCGLAHTTTGARVFASMKGACDGGLNVPHNEKRLVGYKPKKGDQEAKFDPAVLRQHIFGQHVAHYMKILQEESQEKYEKQFSQFIKNGLDHTKIEAMYTKAHQKIRETPAFVGKDHSKYGKDTKNACKNRPKMTLKDRANRIHQMLEAMHARGDKLE